MLHYIILGVFIVIVIIGGILMRTKFRDKRRIYTDAVLLSADREFREFEDEEGNKHKVVTKLKMTFGFRDGSTKTFDVDFKMRGKAVVNQWGKIMYEGDNLLKFESADSEVGKKLYVPAKNSVVNKFNRKK